MGKPREEQGFGAGWIAAIVALALLLTVGIVLYLRMSAPLSKHRRASGHPPVLSAVSSQGSPHHVV